MIIPFAFIMAGCGGGNTDASVRTMSLSTNPALTFTVDAKDKVVAVTFDNADAGTIYANIDFVNMNIDEAIDAFVEVGTITGHLNFDGTNNFELVINGEVQKDVTALKNKVEEQIKAKCTELGLATPEFDLATAEEALNDLATKVKNLAPEYTIEELKAMGQEDMDKLIELAKTTQEKYAGICYTQMQSIIDQFTTESGAKKYFYDQIAVARTTFKEAEELLKTVPAAGQAYAEAILADAKAEFELELSKFEKEMDDLIAAAVTAAQSAQAQLVLDAKNSTISFKASADFSSLTEAQKNMMNDLINKYFPTEA